ncbi:MAG: hypothetical protein IKL36_04140 [Clostridia bacterium]|nr:hypothetical protein [Clostridia bacterium]
MLKVIIGVKGTGKTKQLIEMVNQSLDTTKGDVVCIEKGDKLRFEVKPQCRLIDTKEYAIDDAEDLYGFVAGILASNNDVTDLYIDSALKICRDDVAAFDIFLDKVAALVKEVNCVMTISLPAENATDTIKKYL